MEREELIKKWLDNELNPQELEAFKKLEDYKELITLSNNLTRFKAPEYNIQEELNSALQNINTSKNKNRSKTHWLRPVLRIAAILAVSFSVYYYTTTLDTNINTLAAQKTTIELPDASNVSLNAKSKLVYNKSRWDKNRDVILEGEAFFKVAKGSTFNVKTKNGVVTVLGTEFNIKQRDNYFEVICYEGSVKVTHNSDIVILKPGNSFLKIDGKLIAREKETSLTPSWINNESYFKSMPFEYVIREFERQYNVSINPQNIDLKQLFTGSFSHNNLEVALKEITLPLDVTYNFKNKTTIELSRD
jgi:ferric-dicitrate binding protein FerR (iron transport regulator)